MGGGQTEGFDIITHQRSLKVPRARDSLPTVCHLSAFTTKSGTEWGGLPCTRICESCLSGREGPPRPAPHPWRKRVPITAGDAWAWAARRRRLGRGWSSRICRCGRLPLNQGCAYARDTAKTAANVLLAGTGEPLPVSVPPLKISPHDTQINHLTGVLTVCCCCAVAATQMLMGGQSI